MVYDNAGDKRGGGMQCPVCRVSLVMTDRQGVEIDYCPECRGVWLDRGELDKIIERSAAESRPARRQDQHYDNHDSRYGHDSRGHDSRGHDSYGDRRHDDRGRHGSGSFLRRLFD